VERLCQTAIDRIGGSISGSEPQPPLYLQAGNLGQVWLHLHPNVSRNEKALAPQQSRLYIRPFEVATFSITFS
jgi:hypothetical protein